MRKYLYIFLGAVFIRNGLSSIQAWVSGLIEWSLPSASNVANGNNVNMALGHGVSPFFLLQIPSIDTKKELMVR